MRSPTLVDRVGGPNAISMPGWLLSLPGVLVVVPWIIPGSAGGPAVPWIALSLAAQLVAGLVLWVAWLTVLPSRPRPPRPWVALVVFAMAGVARGAVLALVSRAFGMADTEHAALRLLTPVPIMVLVLSVAAVLVDTTRRHRQVRADLNRQIRTERYLALQSADIVQGYRSGLVQQTRDVVIDQLDKAVHFSPDPVATAARVQQVSDDVVRPLSHELQQRSVLDDQLIADLPDPAAKVGVPLGSYLLGAFTRWPFTPLLTAVAVGAVVFAEVLHYNGVVQGAVVLGVSGVLMFVLLWLAERFITPIARRAPAAIAVALVGAAWLAVAVASSETMHRISLVGRDERSPMAQEIESAWLHAAVLTACLVAMGGLALARSVLEQLAEGEARLAQAVDEAAWAAAKLRQRTWSEQRSLGRLIHRDLQARLVSLALQIQMDDGSGVAVAVDRAEKEIEGILARANDATTWRQSVEDLRAVWGFALTFDVYFPPDVAAALDADPIAAQSVVEVVREATTNAVRHGAANAVGVSASLGDLLVDIVVTDDGPNTDERPSPGIGSRVMDEVCLNWRLDRLPTGHQLRAAIPYQAAHERV